MSQRFARSLSFLSAAAIVSFAPQLSSAQIAVFLFTDSDCQTQDNTTKKLTVFLTQSNDDMKCFKMDGNELFQKGAIKAGCSKGAGAELLFYAGADSCAGTPSTTFFRHTLWTLARRFFEGACVNAGMGFYARLSTGLNEDVYPNCNTGMETIHQRTHMSFLDPGCKVPIDGNLTVNTGKISEFWWLDPGTYCYHTFGQSLKASCDHGWTVVSSYSWKYGSWAASCAGLDTRAVEVMRVNSAEARKYFDGECVQAPWELGVGELYGRLDKELPCGTFPTCGGVPERCREAAALAATSSSSRTSPVLRVLVLVLTLTWPASSLKSQ
eukprot:gnl/TRDRNA2_/TRDRNA2_134924_c0_seq1.p1 gnl/TRDRNA2_/TRDRNA2_134924_c0~~gnl/TRDRNA2_/TRDRNA2_134924_c0_seq1.p1  ORF type:complete len:325 (+),score=44.00 gnl/TRDRNA2_/TRDRNA2_134924_c0_seq1:51-1025(+)